MSSTDRHTLGGKSISMPGLLATMTGFGMLFVYVKFSRMTRDWNELAVVAYISAGVFLLLWGLWHRTQAEPAGAGVTHRWRFLRRHVALPVLLRPGQMYLLIMIVLLVGSLLGRSNMLMLVFAMMAGPFVLNGWVTYSMLKRIEITRTVPERAMAGEVVAIEIGLENRKRAVSSWLMNVRDQVRNDYERVESDVLFARVPRRGRRTGFYHLRPMRRGKYRFGSLRLSTRFPLGLVERSLLFDRPASMLVYPRIGRLAASWKHHNLRAVEMTERLEPRRGTFDDEFHHMREYRPGDNPRDIHWRTSARLNELMVCEYHQNVDQHLVVLLDLWQPDFPGDQQLERVELAVSLGATICADQLRESRSSKLMFAAAGKELSHWTRNNGSATLEALLDLMSAVQAGPRPDLQKLLEFAATNQGAAVRTILITTRSAPDQLAELRAIIQSQETVRPIAGGVRLVVAAPDELSAVFQLA